jgi:hypothetical protein
VATVTYDDGSTITYGADGGIVGLTDQRGLPGYIPPAQGSSIVEQALSVITYGARAALDARFSPAPAAASAGSLTAQNALAKNLLVLALVGAGVFVAVKLVAK